jgi:DNA-binding response OmpR family regulator
MQILLAEDDLPLANFLREGLEAEHYSVEVCSDGERALACLRQTDYEVVVLDLNLPALDGISVLKRTRVLCPAVPVIVLTARTRIEDRVRCFDAGADDYVAKPFSFAELSARIRALIRRSHFPSSSVLTVGDLRLDRVARSVQRAGRRVELTTKEFELLEFLMRNAGRRVSRAMIIENVWKMAFPVGATNVVDVYINYGLRVTELGAFLQP